MDLKFFQTFYFPPSTPSTPTPLTAPPHQTPSPPIPPANPYPDPTPRLPRSVPSPWNPFSTPQPLFTATPPVCAAHPPWHPACDHLQPPPAGYSHRWVYNERIRDEFPRENPNQFLAKFSKHNRKY